MKNIDGEVVYMDDIQPAILSADATDLQDILTLVRCRYTQLFPQWELNVITIEKRGRVEELNWMIAVLEKLRGDCQDDTAQ